MIEIGNFDEFFPFDVGKGNPANTARWRKMAQLWTPDGVVANYPVGVPSAQSQLYATPISGGNTTIQPGAVFMHGYYAEVRTAQTISSLGTSGTIVAKVDLVNQVCLIYFKAGATDYGSNPSTNFEQSASNWEIPLWLVSGTQLTDLRNLIIPGQGVAWWNLVAGPIPVNTSQTVNTQVLTMRVPYAGWVLLRGEMMITFTDVSVAQSIACSLIYENGLSDQYPSTPQTVVPTRPGGGPAGGQTTEVVAMSLLVPVTQGKKIAGWRTTGGTGSPFLNLTTLTMSATMFGLPAAA